MSVDIDQLAVDTIRGLCIDMIQRADSGHPGTPLGIAPVAYAVEPGPPVRPDRPDLAQPGSLHPVRGTRLGPAVVAAAPCRGAGGGRRLRNRPG